MTQRSSATARRDSNTHSGLNTNMHKDQDGQTEDDITAGDYGSGNSATLKDFSTVYGTVRNYKKFAWATPFLVAGEVAMELLIPFLMAILIDRGVSARNMSEVWKWGDNPCYCCIHLTCFRHRGRKNISGRISRPG